MNYGRSIQSMEKYRIVLIVSFIEGCNLVNVYTYNPFRQVNPLEVYTLYMKSGIYTLIQDALKWDRFCCLVYITTPEIRTPH